MIAMHWRELPIGIGALLVIVNAPPAKAATITVTNTLDSGPGSLRQAVLAASPGDTVAFESPTFSVPLTITLTSGHIEITKSLIIDGSTGGTVTPIVSGGDRGGPLVDEERGGQLPLAA